MMYKEFTRDELINILRGWHKAFSTFNKSHERNVQALAQAADMLEKGKWISVNDRLPEESDGTVLVCFPNVSPYNLREQFVNAKHDQRVTTAHYSQYSNTWYIGDMCGVGGTDPTHWMPLPEPPKEE